MELQMPLISLFLFSLLIFTGYEGVEGGSVSEQQRGYATGFHPTKLFVFGDSYADTGNNAKSASNSWKVPYGLSFPGKPAGRYSDGRVLTDYIARFVGLKTPIPYRVRKFAGNRLRDGIDFAFGGSGVFQTLYLVPNMTTQIDYFENVIKESVYTKKDLESSLALVALSGNDYGAYNARGGTPEGLPAFITTVVNQLAINLKRIHDLGVRKVAVTGLQPLGCLPQSTFISSFQQCNSTQNTAVAFHNLLLQQAVANLNNESKDSSILVIDLYSSFTTVLANKGDSQGDLKFESPLKPCCMGISSNYSCANMDDKGEKMYTVCSEPKSAFFWDNVHPTQAGWRAVYLALRSNLQEIYN